MYKDEIKSIQARIDELCNQKEQIDNELKKLWDTKTLLMERELDKLNNSK